MEKTSDRVAGAQNYQLAAKIISESGYTIALTGAGISVPSGIPDFRSADSGLWEKHNPMEVASLANFTLDPRPFYNWIRPLFDTIKNARPNPAHLALTELQKKGALKEIITQNIDGLHEAAGSQSVLPIHGNTATATCQDCFTKIQTASRHKEIYEGTVPRCEICDGLLKPDIIFFGEMLPPDLMDRAQQAALQADLVIVAGSSLEVFPAGELPLLCVRNGGKLLLLNQGPTQLDKYATLKISSDLASSLPAIADELSS